jgi:hypothetical protein
VRLCRRKSLWWVGVESEMRFYMDWGVTKTQSCYEGGELGVKGWGF